MKRPYQIMSLGFSFLISILLITGCAKDEGVLPAGQLDERGSSTTGYPANTNLVGLSADNEIVRFTSGPPATEVSAVKIQGLQPEEVMLAIDYRPSTGQLYGISSNSMIYIIDANTATATPVSGVSIDPKLNGQTVAFDFNPQLDRIRLVTDTDLNLRIHPGTGMVVGIDVPISPSTASINSVAYSNNFVGGPGTTLYDIDITTGNLYKQNPNAGVLTLVGSTGLFVNSEGGFDISRTGVAWAVFLGSSRSPGSGTGGGSLTGGDIDDTSQEAYRLWNVNLRTGLSRSFGKVRPMIGLAIP